MPRNQPRLKYLNKMRKKIPGGASVTKYFKRKTTKIKGLK